MAEHLSQLTEMRLNLSTYKAQYLTRLRSIFSFRSQKVLSNNIVHISRLARFHMFKSAIWQSSECQDVNRGCSNK